MILITRAVMDENGWFDVYYSRLKNKIESDLIMETASIMIDKPDYKKEEYDKELGKRVKQHVKNRRQRVKIVEEEKKKGDFLSNKVSNGNNDNEANRENQDSINESKQEIKGTGQDTKNGKKDDDTTKDMIDYEMTYEKITMNMHLIQVMADNLTLKREVYGSRMCRVNFLLHNMRIGVIQLVIVSTQYASVIAVMMLLVLEVSKVSVTSILYIKKRHYKHCLLFVLDISQSIFLSVFLSICLIFIYGDRDVSNTKSKEMVCIWIIILLCIVEYLVTILYILSRLCAGVSLWRSTRTASGYKSKKSITDFIIYYGSCKYEDNESIV
jgi:hypothetical protein